MSHKEADASVIRVIVENNYITPVWFANSLKGLEETARSHKMSLTFINDIREIPAGERAVVVVGANKSWVRSVLDAARRRFLRPILIGAVPGSYGEDVSGTMYGSISIITIGGASPWWTSTRTAATTAPSMSPS